MFFCQNKRQIGLRALSVAAVVLCAGTLHAQFRTAIQGTVTDPQGAIVPGATLTLLDTDTNRTVTATSNASGVYNFSALPSDHFNLTVTAPGFQQQVINGVKLIPEQANAVNVQLQIGAQDTTVNVSATQQSDLDTETATLSGNVTSNQIQHMPSQGRDVFQFAQLAPGAFGEMSQNSGGGEHSLPGTQGPGGGGVSSTENGPQALAGGSQYETNGISIDGISTVSAVWGGTSVITPNEDSVSEMKVTTNAYNAENGRFSGAQLEVTSKSGTNQPHGSAYIRVYRPGLNAYQRYNGPGSLTPGTPQQRGLLRDESRYNQIGGSIGGPFWKDHLFGFFAYETIRKNSNAIANGWYDTAAFDALAGGSIATKYLTFPGHIPAGATLIEETCANNGLIEGVNCRTIPGQGLNIGSPITTGVGTQDLGWTSSSNPGVGGGLSSVADIAHYQTSSPSSSVYEQYNGRFDANVTGKDRVTFAIYWTPQNSTFYNGPARAYNLYHHSQINEAYSFIYLHTFSPTLLNEARVNDAGWRWNEVTSNPQEPFGLPQDSIDTIGSINLQFFGAPGPSVFNQHTYTYRDMLTKVAGNHTLHFGGELTRLYYLNDPTYAARPSFNFYNVWDFLNDAPHSQGGQYNRFTGVPTANRYDNRENLWGGFIQDDWKATPSLTLNMGLRYSYFDALYAKQNNIPAVQFGSGTDLFTGMSIRRGGKLWSPQKGNLGPQFGFAWSPERFHNKAVIRGGYGLNFNQDEIAITGNFSNNPGDAVTPYYSSGSPTSINPNIVYAVPTDAYTLFGYPPNPNTITNYNSNNLPTTAGLSLTGFPNKLKTSYLEHYSLDTQVELGYNMVATVGYEGTSGHHLINQENLYVWGAYQGAAFNPQISSVDYYGNYGASNYNALLLTLSHHMAHGLDLNADFTWAKSMDTGSGPYEEDPYPYAPYLAWGRSDFNFGKAFKMWGLWQPVIFHAQKAWLEKVVGGWSVGGVYNWHGGFPWTPVSNGPNAYYDQSGYGTLRPASYNGMAQNHGGNSAFKPGPNGYSPDFPNGGLAYFTRPVYTTGTYPNVGSFPRPGISRNSFTGAGYMDLDGTLTKVFGLPNSRFLGNAAQIEFRADAFNLFNQTNLDNSTISNEIGNTDFGVIHNALGSRTVNLQARFSF